MTECSLIALSQVALSVKCSKSYNIKDSGIYIFKSTHRVELMWRQHQWSKTGLCCISRDYNSKGSWLYLLWLAVSSQSAWINLGINTLPVYLQRITVLSASGGALFPDLTPHNMLGPNFWVRHPIYKACLDVMNMSSATHCAIHSRTYKDIYEVSSMSPKALSSMIREMRGRRAVELGGIVSFFQSSLQIKCGIRELHGQTSIECQQTLQGIFPFIIMAMWDEWHHPHLKEEKVEDQVD